MNRDPVSLNVQSRSVGGHRRPLRRADGWARQAPRRRAEQATRRQAARLCEELAHRGCRCRQVATAALRARPHLAALATTRGCLPAARSALQGVAASGAASGARLARRPGLPLGAACALRRLPRYAALRAPGTAAPVARRLSGDPPRCRRPAHLAPAGPRLGHGSYPAAAARRRTRSAGAHRARPRLRHAVGLASGPR